MYANDDAGSSPNQNDQYRDSALDYLKRAEQAVAAGARELGLHLYLAAAERAASPANSDDASVAVQCWRRAWRLAVDLKQRSMAEYVFEKLEPSLSAEEVAACSEQLQKLALDRLEEFGVSREELEDMAEMIAEDFPDPYDGSPVVHIGRFPLPGNGSVEGSVEIIDARPGERHPGDSADEPPAETVSREDARNGEPSDDAADSLRAPSVLSHEDGFEDDEPFDYDRLAGYDGTVAAMRRMGVGMEGAASFDEFIEQMNRYHGLDRMPPFDSIVFASASREDALRFVEATAGELQLPSLHMSMEDGPSGLPVLCVTSKGERRPRLNAQHNRFKTPAVLVLEALDEWISPDDFGDEGESGPAAFMAATMSRGAREAFDLIRAGVEDPDVVVLATTSLETEIDPFFLDLLSPTSVVRIDLPTEAERAAIWTEIAEDHPSLRLIDRAALVRYTEGMARYDIYLAARDAIEEAYKLGLARHTVVPVTPQLLFERIAAYQMPGTPVYQALENAVISGFERDLDRLDEFVERERGAESD